MGWSGYIQRKPLYESYMCFLPHIQKTHLPGNKIYDSLPDLVYTGDLEPGGAGKGASPPFLPKNHAYVQEPCLYSILPVCIHSVATEFTYALTDLHLKLKMKRRIERLVEYSYSFLK